MIAKLSCTDRKNFIFKECKMYHRTQYTSLKKKLFQFNRSRSLNAAVQHKIGPIVWATSIKCIFESTINIFGCLLVSTWQKDKTAWINWWWNVYFQSTPTVDRKTDKYTQYELRTHKLLNILDVYSVSIHFFNTKYDSFYCQKWRGELLFFKIRRNFIELTKIRFH